MVLLISPVEPGSIDRVSELFSNNAAANGCWCMWFISRVADYHAAGPVGNRRHFEQLVATSDQPVGLLASWDDTPVGWCAVGPRSRYVRGIKTPTFAGRDPDEDDDVWLIPCFFVGTAHRKEGLSEKLLAAAVELARSRGARALEAFPHAGSKRRSGDAQVGSADMFLRQGFEVIRTPSPSRVVVRLDFEIGERSGSITPGSTP
jgi:GNAT superfamily N-acetyltransferase